MLRPEALHVWRIPLDQPETVRDGLQQSLAADEQERAGRFVFLKDCHRFLVARAALRDILSRYLHTAAGDIHFEYSEFGKPALARRHHSDLQFNLSHSNGLALLALTRNRRIGVDIEFLRPVQDFEQIARRFFSANEAAALFCLPAAQRPLAFFTCWTRKEAYIKAVGEGLSHPLAQFDVSLAPDQPAALLATRPDPAEAGRWSLYHLAVDEGYVAALALEGGEVQLSCWQWHPAGIPHNPSWRGPW
ncbi:MAG: 4'-phosphopantetheinyl transferase superfamily protein [candidate division KSB1 bacterium]|nr:4'-phosphopantetheinyl transferase superfamily protein [candidate division KSB1 bacterium]MDZ7275833.1 4'-phosphopantetheinyl transferase superfamily protein [candidate division KSB1 bacterium]MDZ7287583.1 4'-phosphopantetheinyl transferase superfamily protein [candidate division KSB1 bacterium]MDZ7306513.1 4'-phosphopantetheinyl transferase superfamily protein [candidate division KSB1 bacterium]MDZ7350561.1 4'-phosphopantetheinyl transferase superfamily protein [candidate division KSB1 bact